MTSSAVTPGASWRNTRLPSPTASMTPRLGMVRSTTPSLVNGKLAQRWPRTRRLRDPGQFTGDTPQPGLGMVTVLLSAAAWRRSSGLAAPPNAADHRSECARAGFDPHHGAGHRADRLGEQSVGYAISAATTVVWRGPVGAQQLRGGRLGQHRQIQPWDCIVAALGGAFHQRGRVRYRVPNGNR